METISITNTLKRGRRISLPFSDIVQSVLGNNYDLSIVICGDKLAKRINTTYRHKTYIPNVLSFPLDKNSGEIFIDLRKVEREAYAFSHTPRKHTAYLLIHGLLHLKGFSHGSTMESEEQKVLKAFSF